MTSDAETPESGPAERAPAGVKWRTAALLLLTVVALGLRWWGLDFGLPLLSNPYVRPDELLVVVATVRMLESAGDPHLTVYPALFMAVCAVAFQAYHALAAALGMASGGTVPLDFGLNPSVYFLLARGLSALCGALTVPAVYFIGRRLGSQSAAWMAAGLLAVTPLAARDAHFAVTDTTTALLMAVTVIYLLNASPRPARLLPRSLVAGSVWLGLAIGCKYSALCLLPLLAGVCFVPPQPLTRRAARLLLCLGLVGVAFLLCNPYVLVRPLEYWAAMRGTAGFVYAQPGDSWDAGVMLSQLARPLRYGPGGYLGLALAAVGAAWCMGQTGDRTQRRLLLAALLTLIPVLSPKLTVFFRYALLSLPPLAVLAGLGWAWLGSAVPARWRGVALGLVAAVCLAPTAALTGHLDLLLARDDTRTVAGEWVARQVSLETPVVLYGGPETEAQIPETRASLVRRREYVRRQYGPGPAQTINQLYDLQLAARAATPDEGYELFRQPGAAELPPPPFILLQGAYPSREPPPLPETVRTLIENGRISILPAFEALGLAGQGPYDRDRLDAFFLPFSNLGQVERPGPNLFLYHVAPARPGGRP